MMTRLKNATVRLFFSLVVLLTVPVCCSNLSGQTEEPVAQQEDSGVTRVVTFRLKNVPADVVLRAVTESLDGVEGVRLDADVRLNSIYMSGSEETIQQVSDLIEKLDVDQTPPQVIRIVSLQHIAAQDGIDVIGKLFATNINEPSTFTMAIDPRTNSVLITGEEAQIRAAVDILEQLDVPMGAAEPKVEPEPRLTGRTVKITWLVDASEVADEIRTSLRKPPASLQAMVDELETSGEFGELMSMTSIQVAASADLRPDSNATSQMQMMMSGIQRAAGRNGSDENQNHFSSKSQRYVGEIGVELYASGQIYQERNSDQYVVMLTVEFELNGESVSLQTTMSMPEDHPVAFSVTDTGIFRTVGVVEIANN